MSRYVLRDATDVKPGILFTDNHDFVKQLIECKAVNSATREEYPNSIYCLYCGELRRRV